MSTINDRRPAFPVLEGETQWLGITMRDYFAAKALLAGWAANMTPAYDNETRARYAYELADAMLRARSAK